MIGKIEGKRAARIVGLATAMVMGCGPSTATTDTTTATGSTGGPASTSSSSGVDSVDATSAPTSAEGTTLVASTTSDGASTAEQCAASVVDDCCCFGVVEDFQTIEVTCPSVELCDPIGVDCATDPVGEGQGCDLMGAGFDDPAAVDCALEALASGSVGHFRAIETPNGGYSGRNYTLYTTGAGEAFVVAYGYEDFGQAYEPVQRWTLQPPEFYEACQGAPTAVERYACVRDGLVEAVEECVVP